MMPRPATAMIRFMLIDPLPENSRFRNWACQEFQIPNSTFFRAGCKTSSLAGGREGGRPAGRGAVGRDQCFSGEHPVGLFADRTRLGLILQRLVIPTARSRECR